MAGQEFVSCKLSSEHLGSEKNSEIPTPWITLTKDLKEEDLEALPRQGKKSSQNIIESIEKSKDSQLNRFIFALGIRFVGEQTAKSLAQHFGDLESFLKATEEELLQIDDIGPKVSSSIVKSLDSKEFVHEARSLVELGVKFEAAKSGQSTQFSGMTFPVDSIIRKNF